MALTDAASYCGADYRRFCYSVGNADVPYTRNGLLPSVVAPMVAPATIMAPPLG